MTLGLGPVAGLLDPVRLTTAADLHLRLDPTGKPSSSAGSSASGTVAAWRPSGTGTPRFLNSCLPWYSRRSMAGR